MLKVLACIAMIISVSCSPRKTAEKGQGSGSNFSEVNVGFPQKDKFGANASKLSGFLFEIQPLGSGTNCKGAFSTVEAYIIGGKKIAQSITQGCDYNFIAEVGAFDPASKKLTAAYFSNRSSGSQGKKLTAAEFKGKSTFALTLQLDVTEAGRREGFSGSAETMSETELQIEVIFGPSSIQSPSTPSTPKAPIPQLRDSIVDFQKLSKISDNQTAQNEMKSALSRVEQIVLINEQKGKVSHNEQQEYFKIQADFQTKYGSSIVSDPAVKAKFDQVTQALLKARSEIKGCCD